MKPPAESKPAPPPKPRRELVCAGVRNGTDEMLMAFYEIEPGNKLGEMRLWTAKKFRGVFAGAVFSIEHEPNEPTTVYINSAKYVRAWKDDTERATWEALDRAATLVEHLAKEERKEKRRDVLAETLLPLRREYHKLISRAHRQAFELQILSALRLRP